MDISNTVNGTTLYSVNHSTPSLLNSTACEHYLERYNMSEIKFLESHIPAIIGTSRVLPPIWWLVGIISNSVALLVWLQPKMRHSSGFYLAALAITDLCFLLMNIVYEVHYTHMTSMLDKPVLCQWYVISYLTVQYMSPVLVLAFTVERYLSVCHPFRMVNFNQSNVKVTVIVILSLTLGCLSLNAAQGYFWTTDQPDKTCDIRAQILESGVWTVWTWTTEVIIFGAVPFTVLILNILVIIEVTNIARLEERNMRTNSIDRRSTTLMLLGVSFYQILTVLPVTVVYALYNEYPPGDLCMGDDEIAQDPTWQSHLRYSGTKTIIQNIGMSHYAVNFFIYLLTGKIFRKQLYEILVMFCCKEKFYHVIRSRTMSTKVTRMSLTSHRGSIAKPRAIINTNRVADVCNNDTELGNKNTNAYSMAELETRELSQAVNTNTDHHALPSAGVHTRLLQRVDETDTDNNIDRDRSVHATGKTEA